MFCLLGGFFLFCLYSELESRCVAQAGLKFLGK
jgi:hypothetical protein